MAERMRSGRRWIGAAAGLILGWASLDGARADWRNTRWHMTLAELKALYPDIAAADKFFPPALTARTPVSYLGHIFTATFLVYQDALIGVRLTLLNETGCADLPARLTRTHGGASALLEQADTIVKSWQWYGRPDDIALDLYRDGACSLRFYDPGTTKKPEGLPF